MKPLTPPTTTDAHLTALLAARGSQLTHQHAICAVGEPPISYGELLAHASAMAAGLRRRGIRRGDRVAIVLPNGPAMSTAFLGVAACAVSAPLNTNYRPEEFEFYLSDLEAKLLITEAGSRSPAILAAEAAGIERMELASDATDSCDRFPDEADPSDTALVLHTSGTTSRPKLVELTHGNLLASARNIAQTLRLTQADRCLNVMPLFHIHGLVAGLLAPLFSNGSVVCAPGFLPGSFFDWARSSGATWYTAVPTIHQSILAETERKPESVYRGFRFARSSSSALAPATMHGLEKALGVPLVEAYGMTEAAHQIACNPLPPRHRRPGSVGLAAGPEIAVMDAHGALLATGAVGEIVIRGDNVTSGYANNPVANAEAFTNGWIRTGDQGFLDEDGYLSISGRLKEIINRGGEKISPREIDEILLEHPAVREAVTFAVPDPDLGETVAAAIVFREGKNASEQELRDFAASRLAYFKVPSAVLFLDEIPKGPTGKIQRIGLAKKLGLEAPSPKTKREYEAPNSDVEQLLAGLWAEVLNADAIGATEDFLNVGGDSIKAAQLIARVQSVLDIELSITELFDAPTIRAQAKIVEGLLLAEPTSDAVARG